MEITESQIYEGFGLEQPQQEQLEQESTMPAAGVEQPTQEPGAPDQEEAKQVEKSPTGETETEREPEQTEHQEEAYQGEMSLEQRRENAARRRRAETQSAINAAVEAERQKNAKEVEDFFSTAGLKNTLTGEPIKSMGDYMAWKKDFDAARAQADLDAGKITRETLDAAIKNNPVVQQAAQLVQKAREQEEQQQRAAMEAQVERELEQIRQWNPNINTVDDLMQMPNAQEFYQLVKRGNSFVDAYRLANYDQITQMAVDAARQQAAAAGRQQAQNLARSKDHLRSGTQQGAGAATVPRGEMELFRAFNPQASEADIQAYYNKYQGGK